MYGKISSRHLNCNNTTLHVFAQHVLMVHPPLWVVHKNNNNLLQVLIQINFTGYLAIKQRVSKG